LLAVFCKFLAQALGIPTVCFTAFTNLKALGFCISQVLEFFVVDGIFHAVQCFIFSQLKPKTILSPSALGLFIKNAHDLAHLAEFRGV